MRRPSLSYANVVSTLALVIAVSGGTAYAAAQIRTSDIRAGAITNSRLANNAVTGAKVKAGTLTAGDFRSGSLPAGATGPAGPAGPAGAAGAAGAAATTLAATINSFGTIIFGNGVLAVSNSSPGVYLVSFNRSVQNCTTIGTVGGYQIGGNSQGPQNGSLVINSNGDSQPAVATVITRDSTGASANLPFHIAAFC